MVSRILLGYIFRLRLLGFRLRVNCVKSPIGDVGSFRDLLVFHEALGVGVLKGNMEWENDHTKMYLVHNKS